jgi:DNA repair exonuclease SbcCD ATPase subunit
MKFKNLSAENFLSISNLDINLDNQGLILIQGDNQDDSNFDSNGAGKTTFMDSISWVLYGKTLKGLKADEVLHNKVKKNCMVSLEIEDDNGDSYKVIRGRKHKEYKNSVLIFKNETNITGKSDKDTNEFIESLLQMSYDVFVATILYSSNSFKFTSATDAEMKKSLDNMLNMEFWNLCLDETKRRIDEVKKEISTIENSIDRTILNQSNLMDQKKLLADKSIEAKTAGIRKKQELTARLDKAKKDLEDLKDSSEDETIIKKMINVASDKISEINAKLDDFDDIFDEINSNKSMVSEIEALIKVNTNTINELTTKADNLLKKLDDKKALIGTDCPVCGSEITEKSLEGATKEMLSELQSIMNDRKTKKSSKEKHEKQLVFFKDKVKELQDKYEQRKPLSDEKTSYEQVLANNKAKLNQNAKLKEMYSKSKKQYTDLISTLEKDIKDIESPGEDTYAPKIEEISGNIDKCSKELEALRVQLEEKNNKLANLEVWLDPYSNKGIKSRLLDSVTPFLNKQSNYYLGKLTSGSIEVEFKTQDTNKSGNTHDKLTLNITNTNGGDKYASNSDGERRRIDISVNLALQDLISNRSTKRINVAFYDECFDSLDGVGSERVIEILNENKNNKSSIFVTTHKDDLKAFFDKSITMVKKNGFTTLKESL